MSLRSSPSEVARETIRQMAQRRMLPTPANYARLFAEISGDPEPGLPAESATSMALRKVLVEALKHFLAVRFSAEHPLYDEAQAICEDARTATSVAAIEAVGQRLRRFILRIELSGESDAETVKGLWRVLELVVSNVGELVEDERWVKGQIEHIRKLLTGQTSVPVVREIEQSFRSVIVKQSSLKREVDSAKASLKDMLSSFVERLGNMTAHTGKYQEKLGGYVERIEKSQHISELNQILAALVADTRAIQADTMRSHEELQTARGKVQAYEERIATLQKELETTSALVREDPLTRVLNRRGYDEAWGVEVARAARLDSPLCLAVMDVDHFKQLNDRHGHLAGDEALVYLARTVRDALRPSDVVARHGGEEFVILLPGATLNEAVQAMTRVQRELTRRFFMHDNEKILITFSAGVTERRGEEGEAEVRARADAALYRAKEAGRNRVIAA
jgi:diguanylate cyclase